MGDGWVTSGLRAVFHKGKVVVGGREGMEPSLLHTIASTISTYLMHRKY
jgi:hypothetical protein